MSSFSARSAGWRWLAGVLLWCSVATPSVAAQLLVVGATGGTGREVVRQALERGYQVRALVRDEARARAVLGEQVTLIVGDMRTGEGVAEAVRGADYVISALGSNVRNDPANTPERIDYGGIRDLAAAAAAARVRHLVLVSSMGVTHEDHPLNKMFGNILRWKLKGEDALRASGVPYTVIRPGGLTQATGGQWPVRFMQGDDLSEGGRIPRADVATVCLEALGRQSAQGKTFELISASSPGTNDWPGLFAALSSDGR